MDSDCDFNVKCCAGLIQGPVTVSAKHPVLNERFLKLITFCRPRYVCFSSRQGYVPDFLRKTKGIPLARERRPASGFRPWLLRFSSGWFYRKNFGDL